MGAAGEGLLALGLTAYAVAFLSALRARSPRAGADRRERLLLGLGLLLHSAGLALLFRAAPVAPPAGLGHWLGFTAWCVAVTSLGLERSARLDSLTIFLAPLLVALGAGGLALDRLTAPAPAGRAAGHGFLAVAGTAAFALAFIFALMYLGLERQLKRHRPGRLAGRLPPLETLETVAQRAVLIGFVLFSAALAAGLLRARAVAGGESIWSPVVGWSLAAWGLYALLLAARYLLAVRGRRAMQLLLAGFLLVVLAFVGGTIAAQRGPHGGLGGQAAGARR